MAAATASTALVPVQPAFTDAERLALAGYLAGYRGLTREAYTLDLRQFTSWCRTRSLPLFSVRRVDIETLARELEARGRARAAVTRRLSTIAGFCKYAEGELLDHSPAAHVRRPRLDYESTAAPVRTGSVTRGKSPSICQLSAIRAFSFAEAIELGQDDCGGGLGELGAELKCGGAFGVAEAPGDGVDVHPCGAMTGDISLRAARAADYNGTIAVVDDWWGHPVHRALPRLFLDHFHDTSFIAERSRGELAGFLVGFGSPAQRDWAYIQFVGVAPEERKAAWPVAVSGVLRNGSERWPPRRPRGHRAGQQRVDRVPRRDGIHCHRPVHGYDGPSSAKVLFERRLD